MLATTELESWYTNSEQEPLNQCQQLLHLTNDSYMTSNKTDIPQQTLVITQSDPKAELSLKFGSVCLFF